MFILYICAIFSLTLAANCPGKEKVCYYKVGCFDNCPPFHKLPLPESPEDIQITFYLFTQNNRNKPEEIDEIFLGRNFDGGKETKYIIHGYMDSSKSKGIKKMKDQLLRKGDYNVIAVDWGTGSQPDPDQPFADLPASNTRVVGAKMAVLVKAQVNATALKEQSVHCIGHAHGAHACSFAAKRLNKIGRISALDPSGDVFEINDTRGRLSEDDAVFVDVIHTNAFPVIHQSGTAMQMGHVDFYPNKGETQPGCGDRKYAVRTRKPSVVTDLLSDLCSHHRAVWYYIESINSQCQFLSQPCANIEDMKKGRCKSCDSSTCQHMGYNSNTKSGRGIYTTRTGPKKPYCIKTPKLAPKTSVLRETLDTLLDNFDTS